MHRLRHAGFAVLVALAALLVAVTSGCTGRGHRLPPTVILVSLDGFRWDYPEKAPTPNLDALAARGVKAENLIPVFPSKTFPNHYSIATGLYPEHHGIVGNTIWDPSTRRMFTISKRDEVTDPMWWGGEPIWTVAGRAGQKTAPFFWPGSEAPHGGLMPTYPVKFDSGMPADARIDRLLGWLDLPDAERPTFLTLYFEDADSAGHRFGPDSAQVRDAIERIDRHLGRLVAELDRRDLLPEVNIVVVSDHGMAATSPSRTIALGDYIPLDAVTIAELSPDLGVFPRPGREDEIYRALAGANPHLSVYRREDTPADWHYRDHARIPPIVGVADEGWEIIRGTSAQPENPLTAPGGAHGYDPRLMSMRGVFVAAGPAFREGISVPPFENVAIYRMLASILGLSAPPSDSDPAVAHSVLRE